MQITRAKATALLNKGEMALYDESRHNAIRGFTPSQLEARITRARSARDRSRDLARRQKLSSRVSTSSQRGADGAGNQRSLDKAEILADILKRFEARLKEAEKLEKEEGTARAAPARKQARKTVRRTGRSEGPEASAGKEAKVSDPTAGKTAKKATAATGAARRASKKTVKAPAKKQGAARSPAKKVTPKRALRSTRKVLEAKREQALQPKPWEEATAHGGQVGGDGFQSVEAAQRAVELQAAGSRMPAIHGSAGTRGRINQGKRDSRSGS